MSATALRPTPPPGAVVQPRAAGDAATGGPGEGRGPAIAPVAIRLAAGAGLLLFGSQAWGDMVRPEGSGAIFGAGIVGLLAACGALATGRLRRALRIAALAGILVVGGAVALLCAGAPARLLDPDHWDVLAAGLVQGLEALPGLNIPYRGPDEWNRVVMLLGGTLLAFAGPLLAAWPRRDGRYGAVAPAAIALATLHAVPAVQLRAAEPWIEGAVLALLLGVFLFAERLTPRDAPHAAAALGCAAVLAVALAPALDQQDPWLDYESLAQDLSERGMSRFSWDHSYGPLDWPREGREVLRISTRQSAYWKATTLEEFDGVRWRGRDDEGFEGDSVLIARRPRWFSDVRVTVRDMTTWQFIGAGTTVEIRRSPRHPLKADNGSFIAAGRPLRRGHSYLARVYVPRPTRTELGTERAAYPGAIYPYLTMRLPTSVGGPNAINTGTGRTSDRPQESAVIAFPHFGQRTKPIGFNGRLVMPDGGGRLVEASAYAGMYRFARQLVARSESPYEYVRLVEAYLRRGFSYTETPPQHAVPLPAFLFRDKRGYCQQFSGAMALLLRMGGVPARIASGFSPGTYDPSRKEYVVRDLDAHSWVEAYFPSFGWVTFDPTPDEAPARSQLSGLGARLPRDIGEEEPTIGGDRTSDPAGIDRGAAEAESGLRAVAVAVGGVLVMLAAAFAGLALRARRRRAALGSDGAVAELERALRLTRRRLSPGTTLRALEHALRHAPAASAYVRALREHRYGSAPDAPTRAQRAAFRRELGEGLGVIGRLRALRALPPW